MSADRGQRAGPRFREGRLYYRWRKEYGGLKTDQARRMKDLEKETLRLRRAILKRRWTRQRSPQYVKPSYLPPFSVNISV